MLIILFPYTFIFIYSYNSFLLLFVIARYYEVQTLDMLFYIRLLYAIVLKINNQLDVHCSGDRFL